MFHKIHKQCRKFRFVPVIKVRWCQKNPLSIEPTKNNKTTNESSTYYIPYYIHSRATLYRTNILYYIILYFTKLYYTIYFTKLYYTLLYYTILYFRGVPDTVVHDQTYIYYTILYYTLLYYTILASLRITIKKTIHLLCFSRHKGSF